MPTNQSSSLIVVAENTCLTNNLLAQHWVSFRIKYFWKNYLFDCAQIFEWLEHNLKELRLNPKKLDAIIVSHDHYDHCNSLSKFIKKYNIPKIYTPTDFKSIKNKNIIKVEDYLEIEKWFYLTWSLSWWDIKEQSAILNFWKKWIIIVWCSHPGIINIVNKAIKITGNKKIMWIMGGLHLMESSKKEVESIIKYFKKNDIDFIRPGHCTWIEPINLMKNKMNNIKISLLGSIWVGNNIEFFPNLEFNIDKR